MTRGGFWLGYGIVIFVGVFIALSLGMSISGGTILTFAGAIIYILASFGFDRGPDRGDRRPR